MRGTLPTAAMAVVAPWAPFRRNSTFEDPATRWPDFKPGMPPQPAVVLVTPKNGGTIGT